MVLFRAFPRFKQLLSFQDNINNSCKHKHHAQIRLCLSCGLALAPFVMLLLLPFEILAIIYATKFFHKSQFSTTVELNSIIMVFSSTLICGGMGDGNVVCKAGGVALSHGL